MVRLLCWGCAAGIVLLAVVGQAHSRWHAAERMVALSIEPRAQSIQVGDRLRLALVARYDDGSVRNLGRSGDWKSSAPQRVRLEGHGRVRALTEGRALITASVRGRRAATIIRVGNRSMGPLRVSTKNPRYFVDAAGRLVYLAGAHTWENLVDSGTTEPPPRFDYAKFLEMLQVHGLRVFRLWAWEQATKSGEIKGRYYFSPVVYRRTGPGTGLDGKPRFDLTQFNPAYFSRLRQRVIAARERGIYVVITLFNGWSVEKKGDGDKPWDGHPFNGANNVNGIDGDRNKDGSGQETHTLADPSIRRLHEAYVARVIRAVRDQPNVLYEISAESSNGSLPWQNHMVGFIRSHESPQARHPVGITSEYPNGHNADLIASSADWISPNGDIVDLQPSTGAKVVLADTDHLCGVCGDPGFPWRAFTRGLNPLLMDPYDGRAVGLGARDADHSERRWEDIRRRLGVTGTLADRLDMSVLIPRRDLASTGYCLADERRGRLYVVYLPDGGKVTVDVSASRYSLRSEWIDPDTGVARPGATIRGAGRRSFGATGDGDVVLVLRAVR